MEGLHSGISVAQMREVDRLMIEDYGIALLQMMENAGSGVATLARVRLGGALADKRIVALIGPGNNGGGGLVAARHLANAGAVVVAALSSDPPLANETPEHQRRILARMAVTGSERATAPTALPALLDWADLIVDALLGYSGRGAPREPIASFIRAANDARAPRLSLDLPSGLDGDTGQLATLAIQASATLTLAWPKSGLLAPGARHATGDVYLADIGVPEGVYRAIGVDSHALFSSGSILRLRVTPDGWSPDGAQATN
ncbi:MAG TPA: NAD(P)H-hydrate epimerase [Ktedonobacterales bacterium]